MRLLSLCAVLITPAFDLRPKSVPSLARGELSMFLLNLCCVVITPAADVPTASVPSLARGESSCGCLVCLVVTKKWRSFGSAMYIL